jgi:hypothetical protein
MLERQTCAYVYMRPGAVLQLRQTWHDGEHPGRFAALCIRIPPIQSTTTGRTTPENRPPGKRVGCLSGTI